MNTNLEQIKLPIRCISYYASDKSILDNKHSYEFWMRSKLTRITCDKPFSRGDVLEIYNILDTSAGILLEARLINEWSKEYPVLNFVSGRLIYNKDVSFKYTTSDKIKILRPIEQILSDNYSIGFIILAYDSGKISCIDTNYNNKFDIYINLSWK